MSRQTPSVFILVPGPWREPAEVVAALGRHGVESIVRADAVLDPGQVAVEVISDADLGSAFSWGRRGPLHDELVRTAGLCENAALLEVGIRLDLEPHSMARLGRALRAEGGVAVRMEGSGAASAWEPWLEQLESASPAATYESAVLIVRDDDGAYFTCGMHQFALPDSQVALDDSSAAIEWLDSFNVYQLAESPALGSGHTFSPSPEAEKRTLERWPDHRHNPNDGRHNPFGVWRLLPEHSARVQPSQLNLVIMPPLVALLHGKERELGRALEPKEVTEIVENSPCIAMERADAQRIEQSRGYADLEPDLAWDQWQLIRHTF